VVTTLLDPKAVTAADLGGLYGQRWSAEISHPNCRSSASLYRGELAA
jgi:hypothetical protein